MEEVPRLSPFPCFFVCRGVALSISGQLKAGLAALEHAILLDPEE